jgi:hypothetical protein
VGIPFEIWELTNNVTVLRLVAFAINVALVAYLVITKRLLGVRGGKRAYEARLRSESILATEAAALEAETAATAQPAAANPPQAAAPAEPEPAVAPKPSA